MATSGKSGFVVSGTAQLYYEERGTGPAVLFIHGSTGDGGQFGVVAERLSDEFRTIVYDRRGNSRSPRPESWSETSWAEQAEDAAAVLRQLNAAPAIVFGSSFGAVVAVETVIRHPNLTAGGVFHEPALVAVLRDPSLRGPLQERMEEGFRSGGLRGRGEGFARAVLGDSLYDSLPLDVRQRMSDNYVALSPVEATVNRGAPPPQERIPSALPRPAVVVRGRGTLPFLVETSEWLAARTGIPLFEISSGHCPYLEDPEALARELRPHLRQLASAPTT